MTNRIFLGLAPLVVFLLCVLIYHSCIGNGLNVDPHAAQEIDKAKRR